MTTKRLDADELDLFSKIIDAFVKKYPGIEHGSNHVIFGDYNLEMHWLVDAQRNITERNRPQSTKTPEPFDHVSYRILSALIEICELLEIEKQEK